MSKGRKRIFAALVIAAIIVFAGACLLLEKRAGTQDGESSSPMDSISFYHNDARGIRLCDTTLDNVYNLFVPGFARNELYLSCPSSMSIVVDEAAILRNGDEISQYVTNISDDGLPYIAVRVLSAGDREVFNGYINFFYTGEMPAVFLTAPVADIAEINAENPEKGDEKLHSKGIMTVVDVEGREDITSDADISRRGNTSFLHMDPKPYNINLSKSLSILGMRSGTKFALKANSYDMNHLLRNEAAFDLARMTEMPAVCDSRFADLYINGEYNGVYLICSRIRGDELLSLGKTGYLMELDYRYKAEPCSFESHDQGIVVHYPEYLTEEQLSYIRDRYETAYTAVQEDGNYEDYIDVDSFVKMYIIQDLFCNVDVDYASFYFYLGTDGLFHAGPLWDLDLSTGIMQTLPFHEELAKRSHIIPDRGGIFLDMLMESKRFRDRTKEYYLDEFMPMLDSYTEGVLIEKGEKIRQSLETSDIKNRFHFSDLHSLDSAEGLSEWMTDRGEFLKGYYEAEDEYVDIMFHFAWGEIRTLAKKGEPIGYLPDSHHPDNDEAFWGEVTGFVTEDGVAVDEDFAPVEDMTLYAVYSEDSHALEEGYVNITQ